MRTYTKKKETTSSLLPLRAVAMTSLPVTQQRLFEVEDEVRDFIQAMLHELEDVDSDDVDTLADMVLSYLGCADETKETIEEKLREFFPAHSESVADLVWDKLDALAGDAAAAAAAAKPPSVEMETPAEEEEGVEEGGRDVAGGEEESGDGASARGADGASCDGGDDNDDDDDDDVVGDAGRGDMEEDASVTPPVGGDGGGGSASFRSISAPHGGSVGTESPQNVPFAHIIQPQQQQQQQPRETQASRRAGSREPGLPSAAAPAATGAEDTTAAAPHPSAFQQIAAAAAAAEKQKQQQQQQRPPARSGDGATPTPAPVVAAPKVVPQRGYRRGSPHPEGASPVPAVIPAAPVAEQGVVRVHKAGDEDVGWLLADAGAGGKPCVFLKAVAAGAPAARSGMGAYVGRRVARINGTPVSRTADCWALSNLASLSVKFGEAVTVEEEGGKKLDDDIERLKESLIQKDKRNHGKEKAQTYGRGHATTAKKSCEPCSRSFV